MALQSSGPISLANIQAEFGGSASTSLSEYYAGGPYVSNPGPTSPSQSGPIPTGGTISLSMFYGVSSVAPEFVFNDVVPSTLTSGYNLETRALAAGWNGTQKLKATIQVGSIGPSTTVYVTAPWPNTAFTIPVLPSGSTVALTNYGIIAGAGGAGGYGGSASSGSGQTGGNGSNGAPGLSVNHLTTITNYGTIAGGGGGGGGGGAVWAVHQTVETEFAPSVLETFATAGSGGGGGQGGVGAGGGTAGFGSTSTYNAGGQVGSGGSLTGTGVGGASITNTHEIYVVDGAEAGRHVDYVGGISGFGGPGGNLGQPGVDGSGSFAYNNTSPGVGFGFDYHSEASTLSGYDNEGKGGNAGAGVTGGANVRWAGSYGSLLGSIDSYGSWVGGGTDNSSLMGNYRQSAYVQPYTPPGDTTWTTNETWYGADRVPNYYAYNSQYPVGTFTYQALVTNTTGGTIQARLYGKVDDFLNGVTVNGGFVNPGTQMGYNQYYYTNFFNIPVGANVISIALRNGSASPTNAFGFIMNLLSNTGGTLVSPVDWKRIA